VKQLVLPPGSRSADLVELSGREHHYLARVRRIAVGERLTALDAERRLSLEVVEVTSDKTRLRVLEADSSVAPNGPQIVLFPFLLKARKLDDVIRQACEAGVSAIVPVTGDHCVARGDQEGGDKKARRWSAIAREAAQQSGSARVCEVHSPVLSREIPFWWRESGPLLFFHQIPLGKGTLHGYLSSRPETIGLVVGPEGGLSQAEVDAFLNRGALPVWLGPFVLRAETASLYAVAAVNTILQETQAWTIPL
jgi:16S rRNA (uracil1498-N3)-methyltransferase